MSDYNEKSDEFEYTHKQVTRILTNYWQLRCLFDAKSVPADSGTHYSESGHSSKAPRDGKASTRRKEDILCALLDIEDAILKLPERMRNTIFENYIVDSKDVCSETEQRYLHRCISKLTFIMNQCKKVDNGRESGTRKGGTSILA